MFPPTGSWSGVTKLTLHDEHSKTCESSRPSCWMRRVSRICRPQLGHKGFSRSIVMAQAARRMFCSKYHAGVSATHSHLPNGRDVSRETAVLFLSGRYQPQSAASFGNQRPQLGAPCDRRVRQAFGVLSQDDAAREQHEGRPRQNEKESVAHRLMVYGIPYRNLAP